MADEELDPETGLPVFRLPPRLGTAEVKRAGYPWIRDPEHPLWDAQQSGWEGWTPEAAMREAVSCARLRGSQGYVNSISHPAYDPGYIRNEQATPNATPAAEGPLPSAPGEKRR